MSEVKAGIVITATDEASKNLGTVESSAKKTQSSFDGIIAKTSAMNNATAGMKLNLISFNQGLELLKKGLRFAELGFSATASASLESRSALDGTKKDLERFAEIANDAGIALGDSMLPAIRGLANSIGPLVKDFTRWVDANRELIATEIIEWTFGAAKAMTEVLAPAINMTARAVKGIEIAFNAGKLAGDKFISGTNSLFASALRGMASLGDKAGVNTEGLKDLAENAQGVADAYDKAGDQASAAILENERDLKKFTDAIDAAKQAIIDGLDKGGTAALDHLGEGIKRISKLIAGVDATGPLEAYHEELRRQAGILRQAEIAGDRQKQISDTVAEVKLANLQRIAEEEGRVRDKQKEAHDEMMARAKEDAQKWGNVLGAGLQSVYRGVRTIVGAIADGSASLAMIAKEVAVSLVSAVIDSIVQMGIDYVVAKATEVTTAKASALSEINAAAGVAAANAYAAYIGIPFAGPILASGAAGAAYAETVAVGSAGLAFAQGGIVPMTPGAVAGKDSVRAMLTPGEAVLPTNLVETLMRLAAGGGSQGTAAAPAGGGGQPIILNISTLEAPSVSKWQQVVEGQLGPVLERAAQRGAYKPNGRGRWAPR